MGIFGKIKGVLIRKKDTDFPPLENLEREPLTPDLMPSREPLPTREPPRPLTPEQFSRPRLEPEFMNETKQAEMSNIKAKMDLLLTEMDSIKTQNQTINERLRSIEKMLAEMRGIRYY